MWGDFGGRGRSAGETRDARGEVAAGLQEIVSRAGFRGPGWALPGPGRDSKLQVWRLTQPGRAHLQSIGVTLNTISALLPSIEVESHTVFDVTDLTDARRRIVSTIVARRGQPESRRCLLSLYNSRCAFTNADASEALEAAHIMAYKGEHTNRPSNGLLLRADIHTLFDLGLLAVNSDDMTIMVSDQLQHSCYAELSAMP